MKKRIISLLLVLMIIASLAPAAFAASEAQQKAADSLHELGLFEGTGTDEAGMPIYELDRAPNRMEAVTMLIRLIGKEKEALAGSWETPFTDVDDWAKPYVGYAYANGLTDGISETEYGGKNKVTAAQYITFVLRALGYDSTADFAWDSSWTLSDELGLTAGEYNALTNGDFTRGNVALISNAALGICLKNSEETLLETIGKAASVPEIEKMLDGYWVCYTELQDTAYIEIYCFYSESRLFGCTTTNFNFDLDKVVSTAYKEGSYRLIDNETIEITTRWEKKYFELTDSCISYNEEQTVSLGAAVQGDSLIIGGNLFYRTESSENDYTEVRAGVLGKHLGTELPGYWVGNNYSTGYGDEPMKVYEVYYFDGLGGYECVTELISGEEKVQTVYKTGTCRIENGCIVSLTRQQESFVVEKTGEYYCYEENDVFALYTLSFGDKLSMGGWDYSRDEDAEYIFSVIKDYVLYAGKSIDVSQYTYLAGYDLRSIRSKYPYAKAESAAVNAFYDSNGGICVVTSITYYLNNTKYEDCFLHIISTGKVITDPVNYYLRQARDSYGTEKQQYIARSEMIAELIGYAKSGEAGCLIPGAEIGKG